jgi:hypothetical protein
MQKVKFTVSEFIKALRMNGYEQARQAYVVTDRTHRTITSACAIGQAALNLGVNPGQLDTFLPSELGTRIVNQNDNLGWSLEKIAEHLKEYEWYASREIVLPAVDWSEEFDNWQGRKIGTVLEVEE